MTKQESIEIQYIREDIAELKTMLTKHVDRCDDKYATKQSINDIKRLLYGAITVVFAAGIGIWQSFMSR